jgi:hypothetical protein
MGPHIRMTILRQHTQYAREINVHRDHESLAVQNFECPKAYKTIEFSKHYQYPKRKAAPTFTLPLDIYFPGMLVVIMHAIVQDVSALLSCCTPIPTLPQLLEPLNEIRSPHFVADVPG